MAQFHFVSLLLYTVCCRSPAVFVTPQRPCCTTTCTSGRQSTWATRGCTRTRCGCERPLPEHDSEPRRKPKDMEAKSNCGQHEKNSVVTGWFTTTAVFWADFWFFSSESRSELLQSKIFTFSHCRTILPCWLPLAKRRHSAASAD